MSAVNLDKMKVAELREELENRGLDTKGNKPALIERLREAMEAEGTNGGGADMDMDSNEEANGDEEMVEENGDAEPEPEAEAETEEAEPTETKEEVSEEKKPEAKEPEKGVKRKFGETGLTADELKPWNIREDEPELDENFVCLDWYNSDLNLRIRHDDFLSGMPLNKESWSWIYAGARATHGVTTGKVFFEVSYLETMRVWTDKDGFHLDLRVGWSTNNANRQLGEGPLSWCYSSAEGKKAHDKVFEEYGAKFEKGDVIGAYLDMGEDTVTMTFTKNGESQGEAYSFPRSQLGGEALFPHILSRNCKFTCNFGKNKDGKETPILKELKESPSLEGYTQIALADDATKVRGDARIKTREECEFILLVGLPATGKTTWAKKYVEEHPEKKFEILNASVYLEKATVNGESRKTHTEVTWEKVHHRITKALQDILRTCSQRRRNIILDQTNVYVDAQLRKARPFEKMKRKCVVLVPTNEDWEARRKKQEEEGERNIPEDAVNEMKANIAFPNEDNGIFDEIEFVELQREEAQAQLEAYNKEAQDAGFGKKHLEYQKEYEMNKKMRGFGPQFGRGMGRGFPRGRGMRGGPMMPFRGMPMRGGPRMRGGPMGGWGAYGYGQQGFGGNWGAYGHGGPMMYPPRGGGYGQYPGNRNWGGYR